MRVAHDIYSETNPAFCACVLVAFTGAYASVRGQGPEAPLAYLALPIALAGDLAQAFDGTNRNTGLQVWLERRPQVQIGLADLVNDTLTIATEAIRLSAFSRALVVGVDGRLSIGPQKVKASAIRALSDAPAQAIKRVERLGYWFADAGSTRTVFDMMGLTA